MLHVYKVPTRHSSHLPILMYSASPGTLQGNTPLWIGEKKKKSQEEKTRLGIFSHTYSLEQFTN